jgi:hypothetical protein
MRKKKKKMRKIIGTNFLTVSQTQHNSSMCDDDKVVFFRLFQPSSSSALNLLFILGSRLGGWEIFKIFTPTAQLEHPSLVLQM